MKRRELIFNDFVVKPEICNFSCDYCLSNEAPNWTNNERQYNELIYGDETILGKSLDETIAKIDEIIDAPILRISGGELFIIRNITDFLIKRENYETIQIITNGYFLQEEILSELKKISNCNIHMSLDGHDLKLNRYRVKNDNIQQRLMTNLDIAVKMGFHVEIGSVLSNANVANYRYFLDYLMQYEDKITVLPFPIRGKGTLTFYAGEQDTESFKEILEHYDDYKRILAPRAYMQKCYELLQGKQRSIRCFMPKVAIQTFEDGNITACPNSWSNMIGNVKDEDGHSILTKIEEDKMINLFLQKRPRVPFCKHCYTSLDIVNLYILGEISDAEMERMPLYSGKKTKEYLYKFRKEYLDE